MPTYQAEVLADLPLGYWRLGESAGPAAADSSGNGRNGTYTGGVTLAQTSAVASHADTAALFDGTTGFVAVPATGLGVGTGPGSIELWLRLDAGFTGNPRAFSFGGNAAWQVLVLGTGQLALFNFNGGVVGTGYFVTVGTMIHVVGTVSPTAIVVYVNGSQVSTVAFASASGNNLLPLSIGQSGSNADYWKGVLDEVAFYGTALSPARVAAHYAAASAPYVPPPGVAVLQNAATANGNGTPFRGNDHARAVVQVSGTFVATVTWETSANGTDWLGALATPPSSPAGAPATTAAGCWSLPAAPWLRARVSGYASGAVTVVAAGMPTNRRLARAAFSPDSVAGLQLWIDADQSTLWQDSARTTPATAEAAPVGAWDDLSGNARHALQPTGAGRPLLRLGVQNGRRVLRFDGTNHSLSVGAVSLIGGSGVYTVCGVVKTSTTTPARQFVVARDHASLGRSFGVGIATATGTNRVYSEAGGGTDTPASTTNLGTTLFQQLSWVRTSGTAWERYVNGAADGTGSGTAPAASTAETWVGARAYSGAAEPLNGDLAAVLVYNVVLSTTDRHAVEAYLKARWGTP